MSSWRKQLKPRKMYKMQQSIIFRKTEEHHKICMREMFLEYYLPTSSGDVNKEWTTNLSEKTMNKFRVHLSWVMGLSVFEWSPRLIGNQIIETFKKSGVFKSLTVLSGNHLLWIMITFYVNVVVGIDYLFKKLCYDL